VQTTREYVANAVIEPMRIHWCGCVYRAVTTLFALTAQRSRIAMDHYTPDSSGRSGRLSDSFGSLVGGGARFEPIRPESVDAGQLIESGLAGYPNRLDGRFLLRLPGF
jgi:hypothetical protein